MTLALYSAGDFLCFDSISAACTSETFPIGTFIGCSERLRGSLYTVELRGNGRSGFVTVICNKQNKHTSARSPDCIKNYTGESGQSGLALQLKPLFQL